MKKILAVLVAIAIVFTMSPAAFAGKKGLIPFWQNGGNVTTLISIMGPRTEVTAASTSTGATITISLIAADTSSGYTILPTDAGSGKTLGTTGLGFATATFRNAGYNSVMQVDTIQIGTNWATLVWNTDVGGAYTAASATAPKFGYGVVNTGTAGDDEFTGWAAIYGGSNPAGFTVQIVDAADGTAQF